MRNYIKRKLQSYDSKNDSRKSIAVYGRQETNGDLDVDPHDLITLGQRINQKEVKAIFGHYTYSQLTEFLGHTNTYGSAFSLTRNPIERSISNINYCKKHHPRPEVRDYFCKVHPDSLFDYLMAAGTKSDGSYQLDWLSHPRDMKTSLPLSKRLKLVLERINIYKVENSRLALSCHVAHFPEGLEYAKSNVTKDLSTGQLSCTKINGRSQKLLSLEMLSSDQILKLQEVYRADTALYTESL